MVKGWIGVDLDGTMFTYHKWVGWNVFGEPIEPMLARIRQWLAEGKEVRVVTARVSVDLAATQRCYVTGQSFTGHQMVAAIRDLCVKHVGQALPVTCVKDVGMIELWDDRAVQVVPNTGRTVAEEWVARYNAAQGKVADPTDTDGKYSDHRGGDE